MAGTVVQGTRSTGTVEQNQRRIDMRSAVLQLEPDQQPLNVISSRLPRVATVNPKYSWWENEPWARYDAVDTTTGTGTRIRVANVGKFSVLDLVKVTRTGEVVRVTSIDTGASELTVVRGVGGSAVALVDRDELMVIGGASPEGDTSRTARTQNPVEVVNYTEITRDSVDETGTARSSAFFTSPHDWDEMRNQVGREHGKHLELKKWHGKPSENLTGGANGKPIRTTGGAFHFIRTNITSVGGTLTESAFWRAQAAAFRFGSGQKIMFAAAVPLEAINGFARGKLEVVNPGADSITYGLRVNRLVGPFGTLIIVYNKLFEGATFGGYAATLDMGNIRKRFLSAEPGGSRDTHIRENVQAPDADLRKDEYLTEDGLEFGLEHTHALLTGITG